MSVQRVWLSCVAVLLGLAVGVCLLRSLGGSGTQQAVAQDPVTDVPHRSPVDIVLSPDGRFLLAANRTSDSVSLVALRSEGQPSRVVDECLVGDRPAALALIPGSTKVLLSASWAGTLTELDYGEGRLRKTRELFLGFEPHGIAVAADGDRAYVGLATGSAVAEVDLSQWKVQARIEVGRWPRTLALSPDGSRLGVGVSGERGIAVVDTVTRKTLWTDRFGGLNIGQMQASADNSVVYYPWMVYRQNPISKGNIRRGWVMASRIGRSRLDEHHRREAISLDPAGQAVADPHGLALTSDQKWMVASAGGTHELLVYRIEGLPWQDYGGPGDHIDDQLLADKSRFYRIPLSGRPLNLRIAPDDRTVYVANYLRDSIQVVDFKDQRILEEIPLASTTPAATQELSLERRGEAIFYDGQRSFEQWYSCHSCHYEGDTNAVIMDTLNDDTYQTFKTVLSLRNVGHTHPWTWHGWQKDFPAAMRKSVTETMQGAQPTHEDVLALAAFVRTLRSPPNPYRQAAELGEHGSAQISPVEQVDRGEAIFQGELGGCANCHSGPYYTDGQIHDVGTGDRTDAYQGYNTPSLIGVHNRVRYLHDGRVRTLESLLKGPHNPAKVAGQKLTDEQVADLVAYLKTL